MSELLKGLQFVANRAVTLKIVSYLRNTPNMWWLYQQMCRSAALGNFAEATAMRASIIAALEEAGILVAGEVALPVIVIGTFFFLATGAAFSETTKKKTSMQELQLEYKKYLFQIDMMELKIGDYQMGPALPKLTFMQFIASRYPKALVPNQTMVVNLKW